MTRSLLLLALLAGALPITPGAFAQCQAINLLSNGDFNSSEGEAVTAPSWIGDVTPDVNDENGPLNCTPCYIWTGIPLASPSGGTWQNLFGLETIAQTVSTTPGQSYLLCFSYAAQGITCSGNTYDGPVGITIHLNGVLTYTTPLDTTQYTWEPFCVNFVATSTSTTVLFGTTGDQYVAIDGACVTAGETVGMSALGMDAAHIVPNPASTSVWIDATIPFDRVTATDATGRIIALRTNDHVVDITPLSAGIYTLQCWSTARPASLPTRLVVAAP